MTGNKDYSIKFYSAIVYLLMFLSFSIGALMIGLKLLGAIKLDWLYVLLPIIIPICILILVSLIAVIALIALKIGDWIRYAKEKKVRY